MKVTAFNGSPRKNGNTSQLLGIVSEVLAEHDIETDIVDIARQPIAGCTACMACAENKNGACIQDGDPVNEWIRKAVDSDGLILASPTYFANVSAQMKAFIDRVGFVARVNGDLFEKKVGAAVLAVRRGGAVPAFDAINHMFQISRMYIVGSCYWNFGFGLAPGDIADDDEGLETMRVLGSNMAWLLEKIHA